MQTLLENKPLMIGAGVVAILIGALLLLVIARMLFGGKLRMPGGRTRQARLGIVDAFDLDRQRQLIIVRRDNTEHLIMIGGPNDLLIESEILRVEARDGRDARREKLEASGPTLPLAPGFGEPRIPAPYVPVEPAKSTAAPVPVPSPSLGDTPMPAPLPMPPIPASLLAEAPMSVQPVPKPEPVVAPVAESVSPPRRTPTFPLPPRRPPTEQRVAAPARPADSLTRSEPTPPSLDPAVVAPEAAVPGPVPTSVIAPPPRPAPPPFLRPLPPRPAKILQRTPLAPVATPVPQAPPPVEVSQPKAVSEPEPTPMVGVGTDGPAGNVPAKDAPAKDNPEKDTLESLEEEMAKLLGRGGDR